MAEKKKNNLKANVKAMVAIYFIVLATGLVVIGRIIDLQFIHKPDKTRFDNSERYEVVDGKRGDILARDGRFLAVSTPQFEIDMDCTVSSDSIFQADVGTLAADLASIFKDKTPDGYRKEMEEARAENKKHIRLGDRLVSNQELLQIQEFPIFNQGRFKGGLKVDKKERRLYPYSTLGRRVLGYSLDNAEKTKVGLEMCYD